MLIIVDMNEDYSENEDEGMTILETRYGLINAYKQLRNHKPSLWGNNRQIFHCFITEELKPYITRIGFCGPLDGFISSDHIPFVVDIPQQLFDMIPQILLPPHERKIKMYNLDKVDLYNKFVKTHIHNNSILQRVQQLEKDIHQYGFY